MSQEDQKDRYQQEKDRFQYEKPPEGESGVRERHESNRAAWNEGAAWYAAQNEKAIAFLRAGGSNLHPVERRNLGDLHQYPTAIHLQCASGNDSLSLLNEGVQRVIGVDISDAHIANARLISEALNAPAEWYRCDVLDVPRELDGTADLVYTGRGAICWLQELKNYAQVVARLLKPGGIYHVLDDHPLTWLFDMDAESLVYSGIDYFDHHESSTGWPSSYIGDSLEIPAEKQSRKYEAVWKLSDIFNAFTAAGLRVEYIGEHPEPYWDIAPNLKPELLKRIPVTFSMLARKPED